MFRFAHPYFFLLLFPAFIAAWRIFRHSSRRGVVFSAMSTIPADTTWRMRVQNILPLFFILSMILFIIALARPQTVLSTTRNKSNSIAIEMVLDISDSMKALDMSTEGAGGRMKLKTRLDAAKEAFTDFIEKRPDDLVGLVTFAGYVSTRAPLTTDHSALSHVLKGVKIISEEGEIVNQEEALTAIGDALATACARLKEAEPVSKIIVLLSDGESNTGMISPETAIDAAKKLGYKVYTIGIGTTGEVPFLGKDPWGRDRLVSAQVSIDEALLRRIASDTGGEYFNVRNPKGLDKALEKIDKLEKTSIEQNIYRQFNELFPLFLGPALALLVIQTGMTMMIYKKIV